MKRGIKYLSLVIAFFMMAFVIFISTDKIRINNEKKPIFVIKVASYDDGGSIKYMGLFYKVYDVVSLTGNEEQPLIEYGYYMTTWNTSLDELKDKIT